ncbi:hypothetical protein KEJ15_03370 [Candidatus Bathyarchaeota archaeon]|nr:hypothetical protein [Candidatus Bathyarchaeota archaeon]
MNRLARSIALVVLILSVSMFACTIKPASADLTGDINDDGKVDLKDVFPALFSIGSVLGDPRFDARCDIDENDVINMADVLTIFANFGKTNT